MYVQGLIDVHLNDLLLVLVDVDGPFLHSFLIVPASFM